MGGIVEPTALAHATIVIWLLSLLARPCTFWHIVWQYTLVVREKRGIPLSSRRLKYSSYASMVAWDHEFARAMNSGSMVLSDNWGCRCLNRIHQLLCSLGIRALPFTVPRFLAVPFILLKASMHDFCRCLVGFVNYFLSVFPCIRMVDVWSRQVVEK